MYRLEKFRFYCSRSQEGIEQPHNGVISNSDAAVVATLSLVPYAYYLNGKFTMIDVKEEEDISKWFHIMIMNIDIDEHLSKH